MLVKTTNNNVKFLLDGQEYFDRFVGCVDWVKQEVQKTNTYIRLAFWEFDPNMYVSDTKTMGDLLIEVSEAGVPVELLLWQPDVISKLDPQSFGLNTPNFVVTVDQHVKDTKAMFEPHHNIAVYTQKSPQWFASYHEKLAIFSGNGILQVLVGGLNITDDYYDSCEHYGVHPINAAQEKRGTNAPPYTCHESSVWLQGPVTRVIEQHWLARRFSTIHFALDYLRKHPMLVILNPWPLRWLRMASSGQTPYPSGSNDYQSGVTVTVAATIPKGTPGVEQGSRGIRELLLNRIEQAHQYIYAENFTFSDPALVNAVSDRLRSRKTLSFCGVIPEHIIASQPDVRLAYARILCHGCSVNAGFAGLETKQGTFQRQDHSSGRMWVDDLPETWFETFYSKFASIRINNMSWYAANTSLKLSDVQYVTYECEDEHHDTPQCKLIPRAAFYAPTRYHSGKGFDDSLRIYIHSKLMLIDDTYTIIGSANFNYRSMNYDGELAVCIENAPFTQHVKQRVLEHFGVPSIELANKALAHALWWNAIHYSHDGERELTPTGVDVELPISYDGVRLVARRPCDIAHDDECE